MEKYSRYYQSQEEIAQKAYNKIKKYKKRLDKIHIEEKDITKMLRLAKTNSLLNENNKANLSE